MSGGSAAPGSRLRSGNGRRALYPLLVRQHPAFAGFVRERWFWIPREEYTICDCLGPTRMLVARRPDGTTGAEQRSSSGRE